MPAIVETLPPATPPVLQPESAASAEWSSAALPRVASIDAFRGLTVAAMILVNDPGTWSAIYPPLDHASWHGWTHTDLIFPFFLFITGISMALSFHARRARGVSRGELLKHCLRRAVILYLIGFLLNWFPYFDLDRLHTIRLAGVLQRIALCYLLAGPLYLICARRYRAGAITAGLLGYWAAMRLFPVPGVVTGDLSPNNNVAAYLDNWLLTPAHMWQHRHWDPEGILSTLPAICTVLLGTFIGELFLKEMNWQQRIRTMVIWGAAGVLLGEVWSLWFPINKNLWTSSYVVFTAGYGLLLLAACFWLVDVKHWRAWSKPFLVFGTNPILAFVLATFLARNLGIYKAALPSGRAVTAWAWIYSVLFQPFFSDPKNSSLAFALTFVLLIMAVMWWLHEKRVFLKV